MRFAEVSWVMLDKDTAFVRLPGERILFTSPSRTTLELSSPNSYPGKEPLSIHCSNGRAYLTTQRVSAARPALCMVADPNVPPASLPSHRLDTSFPVSLCPNTESARHSRHSTLLRRQCFRWHSEACARWQHPSAASVR